MDCFQNCYINDYTLLHFMKFDRSVLTKACLKDNNDPKFVSVHVLMTRCNKETLTNTAVGLKLKQLVCITWS